ncbi:MAG TPA: DUF1697 domain-containing protein [Planctomycetota bacterium]|nr:DUF1697 domain-containing protein [Planctomycetota bacterium]
MASDFHIALLRGVNVGGNNRLPMKQLAAMFTAAGSQDVRTYIQSGNVGFRISGSRAKGLAARIERELEALFGHRIPLVLRSSLELQDVARKNPFLSAGADPDRLHVSFLAEKPAAKQVAGLDPKLGAPDEFALRGREIYLHTPNGFTRTKLSNAYFDRALQTTSTVRNWRTVLALCELTRE